MALGDLHNYLGVIIQVVGLLPQAEHFPHQDPCREPTGQPAEEKEREQISEGRVCQMSFTHQARKARVRSEESLGNEAWQKGQDVEGGPVP